VTAGDVPPGLHDTGAYRPGTPRLHGLAAPVLRLFDRQRLALARSLAPPPARLLDVGAGRGRFVAAASEAGYEAEGIEPSAREPAAVSIRRAAVQDAEFDPESFELITLWHVLEHLQDPGVALDRIRSWLRPSGGLLIGVPNLASLQAQLGGDTWYHLDVPRHRVHFTNRGVEDLLRAHGFEVIGTRHVLLEHNPFGMWQSLVNRATRQRSYLYNLLKRNAPLRSTDLLVTAAAVPLVPVAALLELAAGLAGRGGTIAVLARRAD
jgi:predicted SAM-dependent methyltransferase